MAGSRYMALIRVQDRRLGSENAVAAPAARQSRRGACHSGDSRLMRRGTAEACAKKSSSRRGGSSAAGP
jgi:hypothetical protein